MTTKPLMTLDNITLRFAGTERPILDRLHYQIQSGDRIILLGSNGSGKSSLIKLLNRTYQPTAGKLYFQQTHLSKLGQRRLSQQIVTITQDLRDSLFFNLTVLENCLLWEIRQDTRLLQITTHEQRLFYHDYLAKFNRKLSNKLNTCIAALSGGEKQSLILALCLLYPPKLLLLDEHTSAMDPKTAIDLMAYTDQALQEKNITCVIATHDLDIAIRYGNRLLALAHGEVKLQADGAAKAQLTDKQLLEACYH